MESIEVETLTTPDLESPVLVEGLPGTGLVGTLAVNHLVEELDGQPVRRVYSDHFPPNVTVDDDRVASYDPATLYAVKTAGSDLLVLAGGVQAEDTVGQHRLTDAVLDIAVDFGVNRVFTLGGAVMTDQFEEYKVIGVVAEGSTHLRDHLQHAGVSFHGAPNPDVLGGMTGLILGIGAQRGLTGAGIIGTTTGFHIDPKCAGVVLEALQETLEFTVDLSAFFERPTQKRESVRHIQRKLQLDMREKDDSDDSLRYFG